MIFKTMIILSLIKIPIRIKIFALNIHMVLGQVCGVDGGAYPQRP